jgi:HPt (histidine-containing phosphotransfer) domain-containing protein
MNIGIDERLTGFWEIFEGDEETVVEVAGLFCTQIPELVDDIKQAFEEENIAIINSRLHRLKGSLGYLGFNDETNLIISLEKQIKYGIETIDYTDFKQLVVKTSSLVLLMRKHTKKELI